MSDSVKNIRANVYLNGKNATGTLREMESESRKLRNELRRIPRESKRFNEAKAKFQRLRGEIRKTKDDIYGANQGMNRFRTDMTSNLKSLIGLTAVFTAAIASARAALNYQKELSDLRADVQKTTDLTAVEMDLLQERLDDINTRTSREELLKLAAQAGKLGIRGVADLEKFVEQADKINVALGDDLGEDAVITIGKVADVFNTEMITIGNAINKVADSSKAAAPFLTEFLSRLGGSAKTAGVGADAVLGYGATLDELGLKVEMSSTALSGFFIDFVKNTEKFGSAAGFAEGELSKLIGEEGTNAGFVAFLERLKQTAPASDTFLQKLEDIGITGDRGSQVFLALSQNLEKVKNMQGLANEEMISGDSILQEFNKRNNNLAAALEKIEKWFQATFLDGAVARGIGNLVKGFGDFLDIPVSEKLKEQQVELKMLETRLYNANLKQEERLKIIKQLQTQYPSYLGNVDAEKVSNEQLSVALRKVNDDLLNRITLQIKEEELTKATQNLAEAENDRLSILRRINEELIKSEGSAYDASQFTEDQDFLDAAEEIVDRYKNLQQGVGASGMSASIPSSVTRLSQLLSNYRLTLNEVKDAEGELKQVQEGRAFVQERLGTTLEELMANYQKQQEDAANGEFNLSGGGSSDGGQESSLDQIMAELEREFEAKLRHEEDYQKRRQEILNEYGISPEEDADLKALELEMLQQHFDAKILSEEEYQAAVDAVNEKYHQKALNREEQKRQEFEQTAEFREQMMRRDAAISAFNAAANAQSAAEAKNAVLNNIREQIKGYLAKAIAGAIAQEFATKGLLGAVTGALAGGAVGLLFNQLVPRFNTGGYTSGGAMMPDPFVPGRKVAGITHDDEYVVAREELRNPDTSMLVRAIESVRQGRLRGYSEPSSKSTTVNRTETVQVDPLAATVAALADELKKLRESGIKAVADDDFQRSMLEKQERDQQIENNSRIG